MSILILEALWKIFLKELHMTWNIIEGRVSITEIEIVLHWVDDTKLE